MKSWGILGNPDKETIKKYMNMPHGDFKRMVDDLNEIAQDQPPKLYTVRVDESLSKHRSTYVAIEASNADHAKELAKQKDLSNAEWTDYKDHNPHYSYVIVQNWN